MQKHNLDDLINANIWGQTVGFDMLFQKLNNHKPLVTNYPPYNVYLLPGNDKVHVIEMATAGFKQSELDINIAGDLLIISGIKEVSKEDSGNYTHKTLAYRNFKREFKLAPHHEVDNVTYEDGILQVTIKQVLPEALLPRKLAINAQKETKSLVSKVTKALK